MLNIINDFIIIQGNILARGVFVTRKVNKLNLVTSKLPLVSYLGLLMKKQSYVPIYIYIIYKH